MRAITRFFDPTVVIFGAHVPQWTDALGPSSKVWSRVRGVRRVIQDSAASGTFLRRWTNAKRFIVIPLLEGHARRCPRICRTATPTSKAIEIFSDKSRFARYVREHSLFEHTPAVFDSPSHATFPCVIKRTNLNGSLGVEVILSLEELQEAEQREPWRGEPYVLQEYIPGPVEYTAHLFAKNGSVLWSVAYSYQTPELSVRKVGSHFAPAILGSDELQTIERFLRPVSYNGPCNIDYKLRDARRMAVLEINPRLGGSLMRSPDLGDLTMMVQHIVDHADITQDY